MFKIQMQKIKWLINGSNFNQNFTKVVINYFGTTC